MRGKRLIARDADGERRRRCPSSDARSRDARQARRAPLPTRPTSPRGPCRRPCALLALDVLARDARRRHRHGEVVVALDRLRGQVGKRLELRHQRLDRRLAIVVRPPPRRVVIAPLAQAARRRAQPLDRAVVCCRRRTATSPAGAAIDARPPADARAARAATTKTPRRTADRPACRSGPRTPDRRAPRPAARAADRRRRYGWC